MQCTGVADVRAALAIALEERLELAVRCGGHSIGGWSSTEGGLVIDLTPMRWVHVDRRDSTAWVGGGTRAIDAIVEAAQFGLAPVTGVTADVGLGGLLLGLGEGYLTPRYGFGVDNVLELELVTADGSVLRVAPDEHEDLFWALRGAGPNFGVVSAMKLRLVPLPEQGVGGFITFGDRDVPAVTRHLWEIMEHGSEHFFPLAKFDLDDDGGLRVAIIPGHVGPARIAEAELAALRACGTPLSDDTESMSYLELIGEIRGGGVRGDVPDAPRRQAWELFQFPFGGDAAAQRDLLLDQVRRVGELDPTPYLSLWRSSAPDAELASAAPRRHGIALFLASYWHDAADDEGQVALVDGLAGAVRASGLVEEATDAANHVARHDQERVRAVYGDETYARLAELKAVHDPRNVFRRNFNITPAGDGTR